MTALSSASSSPGYLRHLYQLPASTSVSNTSTDSDGDGDTSSVSSVLTGTTNGASDTSALTGNGSPLALLSSDLQGLLTALQDVNNGNASTGITPASLTGTTLPAGGPAAQIMSAIDSNGDGSISQSEWEAGAPQGVTTAQADQSFAAIDTNGDGSISQSELQNALKHGGHHGHHHGGGDSTSNLTSDINGLLQSMQQSSSDPLMSDPLTAPTDSGASGNGSNAALNQQFAQMLDDLKAYLQGQNTGTVQVSA